MSEVKGTKEKGSATEILAHITCKRLQCLLVVHLSHALLNFWMNEWMNEWMNGCMDACMHACMHNDNLPMISEWKSHAVPQDTKKKLQQSKTYLSRWMLVNIIKLWLISMIWGHVVWVFSPNARFRFWFWFWFWLWSNPCWGNTKLSYQKSTQLHFK